MSIQLHKIVEGLALQKPPLPIATLYRKVCLIAQQQNEKPPSYSVIYSIVRQLPPDLVMLAHEGTKAYADAFELVHRREAERPNAICKPTTRRLISSSRTTFYRYTQGKTVTSTSAK